MLNKNEKFLVKILIQEAKKGFELICNKISVNRKETTHHYDILDKKFIEIEYETVNTEVQCEIIDIFGKIERELAKLVRDDFVRKETIEEMLKRIDREAPIKVFKRELKERLMKEA